MRNVLGPGTILGYCTNVHAGTDFNQIIKNLQKYTLVVKNNVSPNVPMGVGLWFSEHTARQMIQEDRVDYLKNWLRDHNLMVYTLNGFPYGDFHKKIVRHNVYQPDWSRPERVEYTLNLIRILCELLGDEEEGSISTLPLGWSGSLCPDWSIEAAVNNLLEIAKHLEHIKNDSGKLIHIDLEPEPGCYLETCDGIVDFFQNYLLINGRNDLTREYIRVCHDVCHTAVMFEDQSYVLKKYQQAGIKIGKVQISSAIKVPFKELRSEECDQAFDQLAHVQENRYLHQTIIQRNNLIHYFQDLSEAIAANRDLLSNSEWRTHFHVPIFVRNFGLLQTTQDEIVSLLENIGEYSSCRHFEVETYAWNVLPSNLQYDSVAEGITDEMNWVLRQVGK